MSMTVSFRGGETTGSVSERPIETAKQETTGGVGARRKQDSIFLAEEPKCDTVCFRGVEYAYDEPKKKTSTVGVLLGTVGAAVVIAGLLGISHKYNWIKSEEITKYTDKVTKPCYEACKWVKNVSYDKIVNFVKSKK